MFNFSNLSDYEFELLCKDIMTKELQKAAAQKAAALPE